jgi:hypothetical protein
VKSAADDLARAGADVQRVKVELVVYDERRHSTREIKEEQTT